jgi:hypothetical protein
VVEPPGPDPDPDEGEDPDAGSSVAAPLIATCPPGPLRTPDDDAVCKADER